MPIIAIVVALSVILAVGSYLMRPGDDLPTTPDSTATTSRETTSSNPVIVPTNGDVDPATADTQSTSSIVTPTEVQDVPKDTTSLYSDGAHTVNTEYRVPNNARHTVSVNMTLADDIVTDVTVSYGGDDVAASKNYQSKFNSALPTQVIGKKLDGIALSRVGGASLTTGAFNEALAKIKVTAAN